MSEHMHIASMSLPKPKPTHRYRVCGTPSRLGCITCKVRRVKCDETHPFCRRCTSTGRKCDGYEPPPSPNVPSQRKIPNPVANPSSEDLLEQQYLEHFRQSTASVLAEGFARRVLEASQTEPSIRHATIAIAAIHHDFDNKQKNRGESDTQLEAFALRQYTKAITHLHKLMSTTQHLDMTLIACILFISFDCLLGNHPSAVMHLKAGLKILEDVRARNPLKGIQNHEWEREFAPPLIALGVQVATFISPKFPEERRALWMSLRRAGCSSQPIAFASLDEARYALSSLITSIVAEISQASDSILETSASHFTESLKQGFAHALETWSQALENLIRPLIATEPPYSRTNCDSILLKVDVLVLSILIGNPEDAEAKYEKIVNLCEFLVAVKTSAQGGTKMLFSCDQGIIAQLFFAAWRAPSLHTRERAIKLLLKTPGREGLWDASDCHRVAQEHLDAEKRGSSLTFETSIDVEARILQIMGERLKHRMSWNLDERQQSASSLEDFSTSQSSSSRTLSSSSSDTAFTSSEELYTSPSMGYQDDMVASAPGSGLPSSSYNLYNNE